MRFYDQMIRVIVLLIIIDCAHAHGNTNNASKKSVEKYLTQTLLARYEKFGVVGRPVNHSENLITVRYGLALVQILDLDENKQVLRTNCWSRYEWKDSLLTWDPSKYGGITQIRVFPHHLWTPDIRLYNFADERLEEFRNCRVVINSEGNMLWIPQALFKSTCPVEITYFPFDTQYCMMEFGSWTYDITQLNIDWWHVMPFIDFEHYVKSNEWETDGEHEIHVKAADRKQIKSIRRVRKVNMTDSEGNLIRRLYPTLQYRMRIRRNPSFYLSILVVPCILLSCLTLVLFWLPPESPAKMMLGMNIFVAFFVLLLLLAESTPSAVKNFPLIGALYCLNMTMITLSTFLACIVINLYFRGDRRGPVPSNLRRILIEGLGRLLLVRQNIPLASEDQIIKCVNNLANENTDYSSFHSKYFPSDTHRNRNDSENVQNNEDSQEENGGSWRYPKEQTNFRSASRQSSSNFSPRHQPKSINRSTSYWTSATRGDDSLSSSRSKQPQQSYPIDPNDLSSPMMSPTSRNEIERDVFEVRRYIRLFVDRQKSSEQRNLIAMQWRTVALVLDRLFFVLYFLAIVIAIITLMPRRNETDIPRQDMFD